MNPPLLVVAIGNASRGDDALGPLLAARLRDEGWFDDGGQGAELLEAYQLQVEDALSLLQRRAVLFIDAARAEVERGVTLRPIEPAAAPTAFTHALAPQALLALVPRVSASPPPPAWLLAVQGEAFELGAPLSAAANVRLAEALPLAREWVQRRFADSGRSGPCRRRRAGSGAASAASRRTR
jgi:hydrogenase maturation protease